MNYTIRQKYRSYSIGHKLDEDHIINWLISCLNKTGTPLCWRGFLTSPDYLNIFLNFMRSAMYLNGYVKILSLKGAIHKGCPLLNRLLIADL